MENHVSPTELYSKKFRIRI